MFVLHPGSTGRAHNLMLLERTIQYILKKPGVWFCKAIDIANHWKN